MNRPNAFPAASWPPVRAALPRRTLAAWAALPARWLHRARSRRALAALNERELRDIGLSRDAARREAERPFWR